MQLQCRDVALVPGSFGLVVGADSVGVPKQLYEAFVTNGVTRVEHVLSFLRTYDMEMCSAAFLGWLEADYVKAYDEARVQLQGLSDPDAFLPLE